MHRIKCSEPVAPYICILKHKMPMPYIYQAHFDTDNFFKESKTVMSFLQHVWLSSCAVWGKILLIHTKGRILIHL